MWNKRFKIGNEFDSVRSYIYILVVLLITLAITIISVLVWQEKKLQRIVDKSYLYHHVSALNGAKIMEEARHILSDFALKHASMHEVTIELESRYEHHPRSSLFLIKERMATIEELQRRYNDPEFVATMKSAVDSFNRIMKEQEGLWEDSVVDMNSAVKMLPSFLTKIDQLQRLHSIAFKETQDQLTRRKAQSFRIIILISLCLGLIGTLLVGKIISMAKISEKKLKLAHYDLSERVKELQEASNEINTLRGILPICSYCKNIRNDEGYYEQIEGYIHKHSGVGFSHTICPTCLEKHYPEECESIMNDNNKE